MSQLYEAFIEMFKLLDRTYVPRAPANVNETCVLTGAYRVARGACWEPFSTYERDQLFNAMVTELRQVAETTNLRDWSDAGPKSKVLAAIAECIARTAPQVAVDDIDVAPSRRHLSYDYIN